LKEYLIRILNLKGQKRDLAGEIIKINSSK
jgi:hypothetical protein